ncbi:hypothetical protein YM18_3227 [Geobacter sulfurreducens]|nr:hypothetical protein YM18_3227 [Geobacter sulfurreducens]
MTKEEIEMHNETLATFLEAVLEGKPVPNDIAAAAWGAWGAIDTEATAVLRSMDRTITDLEAKLSRLNFERLPAGGTA